MTTANVRCCIPAPPVVEFDQAGNVLQAWGGPGQGYDWPANEHGIFVDHDGFVWVAGNGHLPLIFTRPLRMPAGLIALLAMWAATGAVQAPIYVTQSNRSRIQSCYTERRNLP